MAAMIFNVPPHWRRRRPGSAEAHPVRSGVAHIEPGQIVDVRIRLTKRGRHIVRTTTRTTVRGQLQIQNPGGTH